MTMLDVGCGWGSLSLYAAARGIRVTGVTIAAEQKRFIDERIRDRGLEDHVEIHLRDYRRSEEHTSELQSLMRISYAVFCLTKKQTTNNTYNPILAKTKNTQHIGQKI